MAAAGTTNAFVFVSAVMSTCTMVPDASRVGRAKRNRMEAVAFAASTSVGRVMTVAASSPPPGA